MQFCVIDGAYEKTTARNVTPSMATLRDDGTVHCLFEGEWHRVLNEPKRITEIALGESGLWCLDASGHVYRWNQSLDCSQWSKEELVDHCVSLCFSNDGELCAVKNDGEVLVRRLECSNDPTKDEVESEAKNLVGRNMDSGGIESWTTALKNPKWLTVSAKRTWPRFRFGLRTMLLAMLLIGAMLGPIRFAQRVHQQKLAVEVIEARGGQLTYAHEIDESGEKLENASEPGPNWLKNWVGRQAFLNPVELSMGNRFSSTDVSRICGLTSLKKVTLQSAKTVDFREIGQLKQMTKLVLNLEGFQDFSALENATKLEELDITRWGSYPYGFNLTSLEFMRNLNNLKSLRLQNRNLTPKLQFYDLTPLADHGKLESLDIAAAKELEPILRLPNLKSLSVNYLQTNDLTGIETLSKLTTLQLSHVAVNNLKEIGRLNSLDTLHLGNLQTSDLSPLGNLTNLRSLSISSDPKNNKVLGTSDLAPLEHLSNLEYLNLKFLDVVNPDALRALKNLRQLQIVETSRRSRGNSKSALSDLDALGELTKLEILEVSNSDLTNVQFLSTLTELRELTLAGKKIEDISPLAGCTKLESLKIIYISAKDLTPLSGLINLRELSTPNFFTGYLHLKPVCDLPHLNEIVVNGKRTTTKQIRINIGHQEESQEKRAATSAPNQNLP